MTDSTSMLNTELIQLISRALLYASAVVTVLWIVAESAARIAFRNNVACRYGVRVTALVLCLVSLPLAGVIVTLRSNAPPVAESVQSEPVVAAATEPVGIVGSWNEGLTAAGETADQLATESPDADLRIDAAGNTDGTSVVVIGERSDWTVVLVLMYGLGVLTTSARLLIGVIRAGRLCRRSEIVDDGKLMQIAARCAKQLGLRHIPAIRKTAALGGPVVLGIVRPVILLPASLASALSIDEIALVLTHEMGHIRRRDHLMIVVQRIAEILLFFHPLVWLLSRRIDEDRERCCDDLVLSLGGNRLTYASVLLRVAESGALGRIAPVSVAAGRRPSLLRSRIDRILSASETGEFRLTRGFGVVLALLLATAFLSLKGAALSYSEGSPELIDSATKTDADSAIVDSDNVPSEQAAHQHDVPHDTPIPPRPLDPQDVGAPLRLQVSRVNPPDWVEPAGDSPMFLADGHLLQVVNSPSRFVIREAGTGEEVRSIELDDASRYRPRLSSNRRWLMCQASPRFDPGVFIIPYSMLEVYDVEAFEKVGEFGPTGRSFQFDGYDITSDGQTVAVGSRDGVYVEDVATGQRREAPHDAIRIDALAFSPDGEWLVISDRNDLTYWKWRSDEEPHKIHVGRLIGSLAFTPDSRYLLEGPAPRGDIEIRDLETMEVVRRLKDDTGHSMILNRMEIIDDGRTLVAGNDCGFDWRKVIVNDRIHFWDIETGEILRKFHFTRHEVSEVAVSPDGRYMAANIRDLDEWLLCLWDLERMDPQ